MPNEATAKLKYAAQKRGSRSDKPLNVKPREAQDAFDRQRTIVEGGGAGPARPASRAVAT